MAKERFINARRGGFTAIKNSVLDDPNLKLESKALLTILLSNSDDWKINMKEIIRRSKNGRDAHYSAMNDLIKQGYVYRAQVKDEKGKFKETIYIFSDDKREVKEAIEELKAKGLLPHPENPDTENPHPENPDTGKPYPENQDNNNTNRNKTNRNKTNDNNTNHHHNEENQDEKVVVVSKEIEHVQNHVQYRFNRELTSEQANRLIKECIKHGKHVGDVIENTYFYFRAKKESPLDLMGALMYDAQVGWELPEKAEIPPALEFSGKPKGFRPYNWVDALLIEGDG